MMMTGYRDGKTEEVPDVVTPKDLEVPMESFMWSVDEAMLKKMQSDDDADGDSDGDGKESRSFESDRFALFGMEWSLRIYPNGDCKENEGNAVLQLNVNDVATEIKVVCVRFTICLAETDTKFISEGMFGAKRKHSSWGPDRISTQKLRNLTSLNVSVELELVDVYHNDDDDDDDEDDEEKKKNVVTGSIG